MSKFALITDGAKLNSSIATTLKMNASVHERLHVDAVSAIAFAARTGDIRPLDRLYNGLTSNQQTTLKQYIRRASAIAGLSGGNPEGLTQDEVKAAVAKGGIFAHSNNDGWSVTKGHTTDEAKMIASLCEKRFINPDGETDRQVFDRNNFAEVQVLGDTNVLKQLADFVKRSTTETETREIRISAKVKKMLTDVGDAASQMLKQFELAQDTGKAPAKAAARKQAETKSAKQAKLAKPAPATTKGEAAPISA